MLFNPKDSNTFASASLDRTVKVWSIGQPTPNFTLEGHDKGVNCVDYFIGGMFLRVLRNAAAACLAITTCTRVLLEVIWGEL